MLWTIFVILMVMWLLGVTTSYTLGGFIHILLLLAIASVLIRIIQGRRVVLAVAQAQKVPPGVVMVCGAVN